MYGVFLEPWTAPRSIWPSVQRVTGLLSGRKVAGACINHPPTSAAKVKEWIRLYLSSLSGPSCFVIEWPSPFWSNLPRHAFSGICLKSLIIHSFPLSSKNFVFLILYLWLFFVGYKRKFTSLIITFCFFLWLRGGLWVYIQVAGFSSMWVTFMFEEGFVYCHQMQFGYHCLLNIVPGLRGINHCMQICVVFFLLQLWWVLICMVWRCHLPFEGCKTGLNYNFVCAVSLTHQ